jgi:hypothetical protein
MPEKGNKCRKSLGQILEDLDFPVILELELS